MLVVPFRKPVKVSLRASGGRLHWKPTGEDTIHEGSLPLAGVYGVTTNFGDDVIPQPSTFVSFNHNEKKEYLSPERQTVCVHWIDLPDLGKESWNEIKRTGGDQNVGKGWEPEERTTMFVIEGGDREVAEWKAKLVEMTGAPSAKRKYLAFLNPASGSSEGKPSELYKNNALTIFKLAEVDVSLKITSAKHEAMKILASYSREDLLSYDAIVSIGGDGMLHEIINGFLLRKDWNEVSKIPIAVIPTGFSNATTLAAVRSTPKPFDIIALTVSVPLSAKPVVYETLLELGDVVPETAPSPKTPKKASSANLKGQNTSTNASPKSPAKTLSTKGSLTNMKSAEKLRSVLKVKRARSDERRFRVFSHLSVGWGEIADCDLESDSVRWLGLSSKNRFNLGYFTSLAGWNSFVGFRYRAFLDVLSSDSLNKTVPPISAVMDVDERFPGPHTLFSGVDLERLKDRPKSGKPGTLDDDTFSPLCQSILAGEKRPASGWQSIPDSWYSVIRLMNNGPWTREDSPWNPYGNSRDGKAELVYSQTRLGGSGRLPLVRSLESNSGDEADKLESRDGKIVANRGVYFERVRAVSLEYNQRPSWAPRRWWPGHDLDVDGEAVPAGNRVSAEVIPNALMIFAPSLYLPSDMKDLPSRAVDEVLYWRNAVRVQYMAHNFPEGSAKLAVAGEREEMEEQLKEPDSTEVEREWREFREFAEVEADHGADLAYRDGAAVQQSTRKRCEFRLWAGIEAARRMRLASLMALLVAIVFVVLAIYVVPPKQKKR
ncbi:ATP-NAD kinase-like domain-containing protein [Cladochytrium replicatum]|nr:ATP-NAD kinase-like domain-containing protein [Cladochytrium replicatum]